MRRLKVLSTRGHCGHQYELWKLPIDVTVAVNFDDPLDAWKYEQRPLPKNAKLVPHQEIRIEDFDFGITHFDENSIPPTHPSLIGKKWGTGFRWFMDNVSKKIPCAAICHGTPQFYEQGNFEHQDFKVTIIEERRKALVDYLGDVFVVCNSHQARKEWGFKNCRTIWHGFDPEEFRLSNYIQGVLTVSQNALKSRPHYRGYFLHRQVEEKISQIDYTNVPCPNKDLEQNLYAQLKYKNYINFIRNYSIFLNLTVLSPMPRCRGETMMCGLVPINYNSHDVDLFIKNGVNGFISNDADEIAKIINDLQRNKQLTKKIGMEARKTAMAVFNIGRYLNDWKEVIKNLTGIQI